MSYGNNKYGGGGRRGGGGGGFQPKPRMQVNGQEHVLDPRIESILNSPESKRQLRDFGTRGSEPSRDTILFDADNTRKPIPVPQASMVVHMQCGIPLDHPDFPPMNKFDTMYDANAYYFVYQSPIPWKHDASFCHIPGFTRYCIDKHGRIINAYNGKPVTPLNAFMIELVPDGPSNMLSKVPLEQIKALAYLALPDDFISFGFGAYSHSLRTDPVAKTCTFHPLPAVVVKNNETGYVGKQPNVHHMAKCLNNDFSIMKDLGKLAREGFKPNEPMVSIGPFSIKLAEAPAEIPAIPVVQVAASTAPSFDEPSAQEPAQQQQAPAQDTMVATDDFDSITF